MIVGFTGTRHGLSNRQRFQLLMWFHDHEITELHHGDCLGADQQVHNLALSCAVQPEKIIIHPPTDPRLRAFCSGKVLPEKPYLHRNHDIVEACEMLLAAPHTEVEIQRSGTWATIRYADLTNTNHCIFKR